MRAPPRGRLVTQSPPQLGTGGATSVPSGEGWSLTPEYQRVTQASAGPPCDGPWPRPGAGGSGNQGWVGSGLLSGEAPARLGEPARPRQGGDQLERPGGAKMEGAAASRPAGNTPRT